MPFLCFGAAVGYLADGNVGLAWGVVITSVIYGAIRLL